MFEYLIPLLVIITAIIIIFKGKGKYNNHHQAQDYNHLDDYNENQTHHDDDDCN